MRKFRRGFRIGLLSLALLLIAVPGGFSEEQSVAESEGGQGYMQELQLFSRALGAILEGYVDDVEARKLFYEAVRGMLASLDRYSQFIDPDMYELLKIDITGEYAGIGTWIKIVDEIITIDKIKPDSAADKGGLLAGDQILTIDGMATLGKTVQEIGQLLRGEPGTDVDLSVFRTSTQKSFEITLSRETIELEAVKDARIVGRAVGYLELTDWRDNTIEQLDENLAALKAQGMEALIIDLRNNGGGLLTKAVELSERFLPKDMKIVSTESKIDVQRKEYVSSGEHFAYGGPLVILVNQRSASASEIFSAAMQDHGRAKIVGAQSFGKASVQSVVPLDEKSAMKLTTARYKSPAGRSIDQVGITPDFVTDDGQPSGPGSQQQIRTALEILHEFYV